MLPVYIYINKFPIFVEVPFMLTPVDLIAVSISAGWFSIGSKIPIISNLFLWVLYRPGRLPVCFKLLSLPPLRRGLFLASFVHLTLHGFSSRQYQTLHNLLFLTFERTKKPLYVKDKGFNKIGHRPTLPPVTAVPLALAGLTSLFGMGRGGHRRYRHLKVFG